MNRQFCDFCGIELMEKQPKFGITLRRNTFKEKQIEVMTLSSLGSDHTSIINLELCVKCCDEWYKDIDKRIKQ